MKKEVQQPQEVDRKCVPVPQGFFVCNFGGASMGRTLNKKNLQRGLLVGGGRLLSACRSHLACRTDPANVSGEGVVLVGTKLTSFVL